MLDLLRFAVLAVIAMLLVSVVIGIASGETEIWEKLLFAVVGVVLLLVAPRVRRFGRAGA